MLFVVAFLQLGFAQENPDAPEWANLDFAKYKCRDFYDQRREGDFGTETSYVAEGAQGIVYKCGTNHPESDLQEVAMKLYKVPAFMNFTEMDIRDSTLSAEGVAIPLYDYFYGRPGANRPGGKIEEFLTGKEDVGFDRMQLPVIYRSVAREMAKMHLIKELPIEVKYKDCSYWNWNTDCFYEHLGPQNPWGGGNVSMVANGLGIPVEEMDDEYKWIDETARKGNLVFAFSHNDPHGENMMIDVDSENNIVPDSVQLIDFDNSMWGYRAWDLEYYFSMMSPAPSDELIDDFIASYLTVWNESTDTKYSLEEFRSELEHHRPYVLMEQMIFQSLFLPINRMAHIRRYKAVCSKFGHRWNRRKFGAVL